MLEISTILSLISQLWYFIPIVLVISFYKSAFGKGLVGEFFVNLLLNKRLDKQKYHLLKNVTLPTEDGTTQIDHIVVSEFGIFVLETKNMRGWIYGDEKQKTWTQKIYKHTSKFQNPLHQNYKHVKIIESVLGIDHSKIFSVIIFVGDSTFKTKMPENVSYSRGFIRYLKSKTKKIIPEYEVKKIISLIESDRLSRTLKTNREHVNHVRSIVKEKVNINLCPKCGSKLLLRVAKQGINKGNEFYGCSSYPACKHTSTNI